jgi:hypothetical protein
LRILALEPLFDTSQLPQLTCDHHRLQKLIVRVGLTSSHAKSWERGATLARDYLISNFILIRELLEPPAPAGLAQFEQAARLDLANALASNAIQTSDFIERLGLTVI